MCKKTRTILNAFALMQIEELRNFVPQLTCTRRVECTEPYLDDICQFKEKSSLKIQGELATLPKIKKKNKEKKKNFLVSCGRNLSLAISEKREKTFLGKSIFLPTTLTGLMIQRCPGTAVGGLQGACFSTESGPGKSQERKKSTEQRCQKLLSLTKKPPRS